MALNILTSTGEQKVNAGGGSFNRTNSAITGLTDGGWVVTWTSTETTSGDIYQRRYTKDGVTSGNDIVVNSLNLNAQADPAIAALPNGGWVITWTSMQTGDENIVGRVYDDMGGTSGADLLLSTPAIGGTQWESSVVAFEDNSFTVAWSANLPGITTGFDGKARKFALSGVPLTDILTAAGFPEYSERHPSIQALGNGGFSLVLDASDVSTDPPSFDLLNFKNSAAGDNVGYSRLSTEIGLANTPLEKPCLIHSSNLTSLVVFQRKGADGSGFGIYQSKVANSLSSPVQVNTHTSNDQMNPKAAALSDGGYVIVWQSKNQVAVGSGWDIYQQRYDEDGNKVGSESRVNGVTSGNQVDADVIALSDGGWVVSWTSDQSGKPEIFQRRYTPGSLSLSQDHVSEKAANNDIVGVLPQTADGTAIVYSLTNSAGGRFKIVSGNKLAVANGALLDADEEVDSYTVAVKGTVGGTNETKTFTVVRDDIDEAPVGLAKAGGGNIVSEASEANTPLAVFGAKDPEGASVTYSLTDDAGGAFKIIGASGVLAVADKAKLDFETYGGMRTVVIRASDETGHSTETTFKITVTDVDEPVTPPGGGGGGGGGGGATNKAPMGVSLSGTTAKELAAVGTKVGTLSTSDPDAADTFTYKLSNDAGGRFVVIGDTVYVLDGVKLDFEQAKTHKITVVATDQGNLSVAQDFVVTLANARPEKSSGSTFADTLFGDIGKDVFSGGAGNDVLKGFKNNDTLTGGVGNDRLFGGLGADKLTGGKGKDVFVFDTKPAKSAVDLVKDFSHKDDTVFLENAIFKGIGSGSLTKAKKMAASAFFAGATAHDANDRILYDKKTGSLWYDSDGIGTHAAVKIAAFTTKPALDVSDFFVI